MSLPTVEAVERDVVYVLRGRLDFKVVIANYQRPSLHRRLSEDKPLYCPVSDRIYCK